MEKDPALAAKHDQCTVGRLVAIVGMVKDYESKKYIQIIAMRPVLDWNERTHHFLEATFLHLQNTRGPIPVRAKV